MLGILVSKLGKLREASKPSAISILQVIQTNLSQKDEDNHKKEEPKNEDNPTNRDDSINEDNPIIEDDP